MKAKAKATVDAHPAMTIALIPQFAALLAFALDGVVRGAELDEQCRGALALLRDMIVKAQVEFLRGPR